MGQPQQAWPGNRLGRQLIILSLLVGGLCGAHQLFMATEEHTVAMGALHGRVGVNVSFMPLPAPAVPDGDAPTGVQSPAPPQPLLGDCPALQAIPPCFLLLTLLLGMVARMGRRALPLPTPFREARSLYDFLPLPPLPAERRAVMQVFLN